MGLRLLDFEVSSTGEKYLPIELWISRFSKQDPEIRGKLRLQSTRGTGDTKLVSISTESSLVLLGIRIPYKLTSKVLNLVYADTGRCFEVQLLASTKFSMRALNLGLNLVPVQLYEYEYRQSCTVLVWTVDLLVRLRTVRLHP